MESFRVFYRPSVRKDLRNLPRNVAVRVVDEIDALETNPFPHGALKLAGPEGLYRIRAGDYRIIYGVDTGLRSVTVHHVRHRRDVYRTLR